jgi:hypothetical protein
MEIEPVVLEKLARYENGLERSLFRHLHEVQNSVSVRRRHLDEGRASMSVLSLWAAG